MGQLPFFKTCWFKFYLALTLDYTPYYFTVGLSQLRGCAAEVISSQTGLLAMCHFGFAKGNSLGAMRLQLVGGHACCRNYFF